MKDNVTDFIRPVKKQDKRPKLSTPEELVHLMVEALDHTNFSCKDLTKSFFTILEMCAKELSDQNGKNINVIRIELIQSVKQAGDKFLYG